ncbi:hypothetical protein BSKO_02203 [Bryopsis sp. KO-2023]|nr:hypothetical protein BSKO_02203 [Bryopsis sp. KO-2023]
MLNLIVVRDEVAQLDANGISQGRAFCVDSLSGCLYVIAASGEVRCLEDKTKEIVWEAFLPDSLDAVCVVDLSYAIELDSLCAFLANGKILLYGSEEGSLEEVGEVEGGILAAQWSPDGEILALISGEGKIVVMTKDWDVLREVDLSSEVLDGAALKGFDEGGATLSWRGDAQYFETLFSNDGVRFLCVWERASLTLHSRAEEASALNTIAWQPNGRHLFASKSCSKDEASSSMILYERNGLRHAEFDLRSKGDVVEMEWSPDSQLLAVVLENSNDEKKWTLQVWKRNNWRWYLKYESLWASSYHGLRVCWDDQQELKLHIWTRSGSHKMLEFALDNVVSHRGTAAIVDGDSVNITPFRHIVIPPPMAALCVTFPSAVQSVCFLENEPVEGVAVALSSGHLALAICEEDDFWDDLGEDEEAVAGTSYGALASNMGVVVSGINFYDWCDSIQHLVWVSMSDMLAVGTPKSGDQSIILKIKLTSEKDSWRGDCQPVPCNPLGKIIRSAATKEGALFEQEAGELVHCSIEPDVTACGNFPEPCHRILTSPSMPASGGQQTGVVGLSSKGNLYFGPKLVSSEVTSIGIRSEGAGGAFLLYTTKSNHLHIVKCDDLLEPHQTRGNGTKENGVVKGRVHVEKRSGPTRDMHAAMRPAASAIDKQDLTVRAVEQGSKIIAAPPGGAAVILQMPRGNLETIHPRVLVLCAIVEALNEKQYQEAWELATTNRVDLNIIVDYNWPSFISGAGDFVASVTKEEDMCDMMMALKSSSVLDDDGLYSAAPLPTSTVVPDIPTEKLEGGKVSAVCRAFREAILASDKRHYLRAIVTTYARSVPPDLESALQYIKAAREAELTNPEANVGRGDDVGPAAAALKHLMLYVNTDKLYEVSLGMYDLEMAYMVVTNAQRDPGEYLMELQQFAALEPMHFRHYSIDAHLKRFSRALSNLVKAGEGHFEASIKLAQEKGLMHELLAFVDGDEVKRKVVLGASAEWLLEKNMCDDAGAAFLAAGKTKEAQHAYKKGCHWEMCLALTGKLGMDQNEVQDIAVDLFEELKTDRRLNEAARLAVEYLEDVDEAIVLLTDARSWREAVRVSYRFDREDLVDTIVAPAAAECASTSLSNFREDAERVGKYWERLKEVREKRFAMETVVGETGAAGDIDRDAGNDDLGDGSSTVAGMSVYTDRTHANTAATTASISAFTTGGKKPQKRRKKKKGLRIRQGTPEEERALCEHIKNLQPSDQSCEEFGQLTELLILLGHERDARTLQQALDALIKQQKEAADDILQNPPPQSSEDSKQETKPQPRWKLDILRGLAQRD